ncbi:hypothetical protein FHS63_006274 [Azospirillum doebereinerae]
MPIHSHCLRHGCELAALPPPLDENRPRPHGILSPAAHQAAQNQPIETPQQGGQTTRRRRQYLPRPSIVRLIEAVLLEQKDEWQSQNRYMQVEVRAEGIPLGDATPTISFPSKDA